MSDISLHCDGNIYDDWGDFLFVKTLNAICDFFSGSITVSMDKNQKIPFKLGQESVIKINGKKRFTGYIESIEYDIDEDKAEFKISGRSKTCDLVDCSVDIGSFEFSNIPLFKLVSNICGQFGISVVDKTSSKIIIAKWNIFPGETAWECLERLSRKYGILFFCNEDGSLVMGKEDPVDANIDLDHIQAPKKIKGRNSQEDRFSKYKVLGQARDQSDAVAEVTDGAVTRSRTKIILSESASNASECKTRASWEKQISSQRSSDLSIIIDEWTQGNSNIPWWVNIKTKLDFPYLGISDYYLITGIRFSQSEKLGQQTLLEFEEVKSFTI